MPSVTSATVVATTALANDITLFASLELSKSKWVVTINSPGSEKFSKHVVEGGDGARLLDLLSRSRAKAEERSACGSKRSSFRKRDWTGFHSSLAARQWDREPGRRCGFDRHRPAASAGEDQFDRRRDAVADADGLGSRRAAGLFHGSRAEPGRRGSPAPDARARHADQGTHSAHQSN